MMTTTKTAATGCYHFLSLADAMTFVERRGVVAYRLHAYAQRGTLRRGRHRTAQLAAQPMYVYTVEVVG